MKYSLKKIIPVFFGAILLAPVFFLFAFQVKQQIIRHRMKEKLEEKMLHSLTLKSSQIQWIEDEREVRIEGRMFDVKEIVRHADGTVTLTGLFDDEETVLMKQLDESQRNKPQNNHQLISFFSFQLGLPEAVFNYSAGISDLHNWQKPLDNMFLPFRCKNVLTPPPKVS